MCWQPSGFKWAHCKKSNQDPCVVCLWTVAWCGGSYNSCFLHREEVKFVFHYFYFNGCESVSVSPVFWIKIYLNCNNIFCIGHIWSQISLFFVCLSDFAFGVLCNYYTISSHLTWVQFYATLLLFRGKYCTFFLFDTVQLGTDRMHCYW